MGGWVGGWEDLRTWEKASKSWDSVVEGARSPTYREAERTFPYMGAPEPAPPPLPAACGEEGGWVGGWLGGWVD